MYLDAVRPLSRYAVAWLPAGRAGILGAFRQSAGWRAHVDGAPREGSDPSACQRRDQNGRADVADDLRRPHRPDLFAPTCAAVLRAALSYVRRFRGRSRAVSDADGGRAVARRANTTGHGGTRPRRSARGFDARRPYADAAPAVYSGSGDGLKPGDLEQLADPRTGAPPLGTAGAPAERPACRPSRGALVLRPPLRRRERHEAAKHPARLRDAARRQPRQQPAAPHSPRRPGDDPRPAYSALRHLSAHRIPA